MTPDFVVRSLHLNVIVLPRPDIPFSFVTTDSRKVEPECLFVALKGDLFDGHDFIHDAIEKGARGIIYQRGFPVPPHKEVCMLPVEDTLSAFRRLAAAWRRELNLPIIVVAGSAGKTTTKELLAAILQGKWKHVLKTQGSQNGFVGIPMNLLELRPEHEVAVIEVGIDDIDTMQQHMAIIGANASVLTAIGPEHLERLRDIPTVAQEEGIALSTVAKSGGIVAINLDDPWIRPHLTTLREGRKIPFSLTGATPPPSSSPSSTASQPLEMITGKLSASGKELTFQGLGLDPTTVELPLFGKHNASNLLAAITVAAGFGLTPREIQNGLKRFKGATGRSEIHELTGRFRVICDYYNAQPPSMLAAFELLSQMAKSTTGKQRRRWACLADMLELGPEEERYHRELADPILEWNIENILLLGPRMLALKDELENRGFSGFLAHFETHSSLADTLTREIKYGDVILIKGSRSMKMEEVWKILEPFIKSHWGRSVES